MSKQEEEQEEEEEWAHLACLPPTHSFLEASGQCGPQRHHGSPILQTPLTMLHLLLLLRLSCLLASSCPPDLFLLRPPGGTSLLARTSACPGSIKAYHLQFLACPDQPGTREEEKVELDEGVGHLEHLHPHSLYLVRLERGGEVVKEQNITTRAALPDGGPIASIASVSTSSLMFTWPRIDIECKKQRSQLAGIRYILKTDPNEEIVREGRLQLTTTDLELSELEPATSYSLSLHLARADGRWDSGSGRKIDVTTLPLSRLPLHLLLLLLPIVIVLLGLLVLLLVRLARRTKQKVQFKKDVKRYLQEDSVNLSYRASSSSSQATSATYIMEEPTYAVIPPKPRETIDPLPEVPEAELTKHEAGTISTLYKEEARSSVQRETFSGNVQLARERSVGEGSKEVGYVWVAGSKTLAEEENAEDEDGEGYLRANFGRTPLKEVGDESHDIVGIPAVSYIRSTNTV